MSAESSQSLTDQLVAFIDTFHAMWNTHDIPGVLECFTEEAVVRIVCPQQQTSVVYQGKAQIHDFVTQAIAGCVIHARSHHVVDNRVIWMARMRSDALRELGIEWVRNQNEAIVQDGKISAFTVTVTPETVAQLEAAASLTEEQLGKLGA